MNTMTRDQIKEGLDRGEDMTLVEALPERYFRKVHLPGAVNLPHDEIDSSVTQLLPDKNALIVVYCSNTACPNSSIAQQRLAALGYRNVIKYAEGKQDWIDAGLPTEPETPR